MPTSSMSAPCPQLDCKSPSICLKSALTSLPSDASPLAGSDGSGEAHARHNSWSAETGALVDSTGLDAFLSDLPPEVVRVKGVLRTTEMPDRRTVVHVVGRRRESVDDGPWTDPNRTSRLVVIVVDTGHLDGPEFDYVNRLRQLMPR